MSTDGTSAKSVAHLVPVTCWYFVLAIIEWRAWPISWNKLSTIEGDRRDGLDQRGVGRLSINTTIGFCMRYTRLDV